MKNKGSMKKPYKTQCKRIYKETDKEERASNGSFWNTKEANRGRVTPSTEFTCYHVAYLIGLSHLCALLVYQCLIVPTNENVQMKQASAATFQNLEKKHWKNRNKTKLAGYIWKLKLNDPPLAYTLEWKVIDKGKTYNPTTGRCRLCLKEKYHILYNKDASTLNSRTEVFTPCPHKHKFLLKNVFIWYSFF